MTLRAILAFDAEARARFDLLFDEHYPEDRLPAWFAERIVSNPPPAALPEEPAPRSLQNENTAKAPVVSAARKQSPAKAGKRSERNLRAFVNPAKRGASEIWASRLLLLAALLPLGVLGALYLALPAAAPIDFRPDAGAFPAASGDLPLPVVFPDSGAGAIQYREHQGRAPGKLPTKVEPAYPITGLLTAAVCLGLSLLAFFARRASAADTLDTAGIPESNEKPIDGTGNAASEERPRASPASFRDDELRRIAYRIGLSPDPVLRDLDIGATIRATARQAGILSPVHVPSRMPAPLIVIFATPLDLVARTIFEEFIKGMKRVGVSVKTYRKRPMELEEDALILVVVHGGMKLPAWLTPGEMRRFGRHVALIEARDPMLWGPEIAALPCAPFTPDARGLLAALEAAYARRIQPPLRLFAPPRGLAALQDALPLAAAAALAEPCSLAEINELRRQLSKKCKIDIPFCAVQRIFSLDEVTADPAGIRFSSRLRRELCVRVSVDVRRAALEWHRERLQKRLEPSTDPRGPEDADDSSVRRVALLRRELRVTNILLDGLTLEPGDRSDRRMVALERRVRELERDESGVLRRGVRTRVLEVLPILHDSGRLSPMARGRFTAASIVFFLIGFTAVGVSALAWSRPSECENDSAKCQTLCFDLSLSVDHCGACFNQCADGAACIAGKCECKPGWIECNHRCVNPESDRLNCRECGTECPDDWQCVDGECKDVRCSEGLTYCAWMALKSSGEPEDPGCVDTDSNVWNCGECGRVCLLGEVCLSGECWALSEGCPEGIDCSSDRHNCGGKNIECGDKVTRTGKCSAGRCERCPGTTRNCDLKHDSCETDISANAANCGACDYDCAAETVSLPNTVPACADGQCFRLCLSRFDNCDGIRFNGCETDLMTDPNACGGCGKKCSERPNARVVCENAQCLYPCNDGFADCDGDGSCETRLLDNPSHCGRCNTVCGAPQNATPRCSQASCVFDCMNGFTKCGNVCADLVTSLAHCGACNSSCLPGFGETVTCVNGQCTHACAPGQSDCDGNAANGCEVAGTCTPTSSIPDAAPPLDAGTD